MKHVSGFTSSARYKCLEDLQKESLELYLIYCGWEYCDPGHRFGPNNRPTYVLHIIREGKGTLEMNKKRYHLTGGDSFLIPHGTKAYYEADSEEPWSYMWVGFNGLKAEEFIQNSGFSLKSPVRKVGCIPQLYKYIDNMLEAHQLTYVDELKRNGYLMLFFAALMDDYRKACPGGALLRPYPVSVYVKHAMDYISCHYSKRIRIHELADYIGVNRSYLSNSFKKAIGCSPQEYLVNLRMEKSKSLLRKTDKPINEISHCVGYADPLAFSKIFKQYYGVCPREYREHDTELVITSKKCEYESKQNHENTEKILEVELEKA